MIKNIIFDIGNVLISFQPMNYLSSKFNDETTKKTLYNTIFRSKEWLLLDRGTVTEAEAIEIFCTRQPSLEKEIRYVMENWDEMHIPMKDSIELLNYLKDLGYHIFFLSNYHKKAFKVIFKKFDFIREVDGQVISSDVKLLKPEVQIFDVLLNKYDLKPQECVFVDDSLENIKTADKLGIHGIYFEDTASVYNIIQEKLSIIL